MVWPEITVEEACCRIIDYRGKTPQKSSSGIRLVTAKVVKGGRINEEPAEFLAEDYYDEWMRRGLPELHDTVLTTEAPLGEVGLIRTSGKIGLGQRIILLRPDPAKMDKRFLHLVLQTDLVQSRLQARATGTTVLGIKQSELRRVELPCPPLDTQRRIAAILGAYDDLIEVNRQRVAVLEEMARGLFEEWFVRFRFPDHETVPILDTPDGPLPEGWTINQFGDLFEHTIGGLWGEEERSLDADQPVRVIRGTDFPRLLNGHFDSVPERFVSSKELDKRRLIAGDLLLEASGGGKDQPVGRTLFVTQSLLDSLQGRVAPASFCRLLRPQKQNGLAEYALGLLHAMYADRRIEKFQKQSTGLRNLSMRQLASEPTVKPSDLVLQSFGAKVRPMIHAMSVHRNEIRALAASRDLLLPRLISGQLSVETAERELEAAA